MSAVHLGVKSLSSAVDGSTDLRVSMLPVHCGCKETLMWLIIWDFIEVPVPAAFVIGDDGYSSGGSR